MPSTLTDQALIERYLNAIWSEQGLSENTQIAYRHDLTKLSGWLWEQGECTLLDCRQIHIQGYLGAQLAAGAASSSVARLLSSLRSFYSYCLQERYLETDPTSLIDSPVRAHHLPHVLSEAEVIQLLAAPDTDSPLGLRDRAMLEVLYATGLRVSELINLRFDQVNLQIEVMRITGKGNKERILPMGEHALHWLERYLAQARPPLLGTKPDSDLIFITNRGRAMTRQSFWHAIKRHAATAGLDKPISPHTLRHAFATHMINHDADLRTVQLLLGHSSLSSTQLYTHMAKSHLQRLHTKHHPRG